MKQPVRIADANQTEVLFTVPFEVGRALHARAMVEDSSPIYDWRLRGATDAKDAQAFINRDYFVRFNTETKQYWNREMNGVEFDSETLATPFAQPQTDSGRIKWLHVKNGTVQRAA